MPSVKTQINCPNCKQPVTADIEQLFDVGADPAAKQRLLSGSFNVLQCPHCGYDGSVATPLVYHDPEKELLLTFFPPELNVDRNEQERAIGRLIKNAIDALPQEQRKGYIFSPQATLTLQGLTERVLHEDGITKEMIDDQQKRVQLIQRLFQKSDDSIEEIAKQEDEIIDAQFFSLLSQLIQSSAANGDQNGAQALSQLHEKLLPSTTFGNKLQEQAKEIELAVKALQDAGEKLTREKLLDIVLEYTSDAQLNMLVSLARPGMDYGFFQLLTKKLESADEKQKESLTKLRETLLEMTQQLDQQLEAHLAHANQNLDALLSVEDISETMRQNLPAIDDFFVQVLNNQYEAAMQAEDNERLEKIQKVIDVIQEITSPGGALLQDLLKVADDESMQKILEDNKEQVTSAFIETLTSLLVQLESGKDKETTEKVRKIYRRAVRMSMQASMQRK
ncbi:MAG: hypothetical protein IIC79_06960 [Chloroflexi bacterium]|nr:hypothetical protein [Chloroflexota bacterium]